MLPAVMSERTLNMALSRALPRFFHKEEVHQILEACDDDPRNCLFLPFLLQTGVRVSKALSVRVGDLDPYASAIRVRILKRKGHPVRIVNVTPEMSQALFQYAEAEGLSASDAFFSFTRQWAGKLVGKYAAKAGLNDGRAHPHTFRHPFGAERNGGARGPGLARTRLPQEHLVCLQVVQKDTKRFYEAIEF